MSWALYAEYADELPIEIAPVTDLREHVLERCGDGKCWCGTWRNEDDFIMHRALNEGQA